MDPNKLDWMFLADVDAKKEDGRCFRCSTKPSKIKLEIALGEVTEEYEASVTIYVCDAECLERLKNDPETPADLDGLKDMAERYREMAIEMAREETKNNGSEETGV